MPPSDRLLRSNDGWLARPERAALEWLAPRVPPGVTPDHLTALGFVGALLSFVGYALAAQDAVWLWLASLGLIVNWFGDSLDGHVARIRDIARPRYGFFLDQSIDVLSQAIFALGLGLSGFVSLSVTMAGLAAYLMMSVQSLLRASVTGVFHLASGGMGLTEVRCLFLIGNTIFFLVPPIPVQVGTFSIVYGDLLGAIWILTNLGLYLIGLVRELRDLSNKDLPPQ